MSVPLVIGVLELIKLAGIDSVYVIDSANQTGDTVTLMPYGSSIANGVPVGYQSIQVRIAGSTFAASEELAWRAYNAVSGQIPAGTDRRILGVIEPKQEPYFLEKDAKNRYIHVFNIEVAATWKD